MPLILHNQIKMLCYEFNMQLLLYRILAICSPPCLNGGKCVRPPNTCRCSANFTGKYCELKSHRKEQKPILALSQKKFFSTNKITKKSRSNRIKRKRQKKRRKLKIKDLTNETNFV